MIKTGAGVDLRCARHSGVIQLAAPGLRPVPAWRRFTAISYRSKDAGRRAAIPSGRRSYAGNRPGLTRFPAAPAMAGNRKARQQTTRQWGCRHMRDLAFALAAPRRPPSSRRCDGKLRACPSALQQAESLDAGRTFARSRADSGAATTTRPGRCGGDKMDGERTTSPLIPARGRRHRHSPARDGRLSLQLSYSAAAAAPELVIGARPSFAAQRRIMSPCPMPS